MTAEFTGCDIAVMAAYAGVISLAVVYGLAQGVPTGSSNMTAIADICAQRVTTVFTRSDSPSMTETALRTGLTVIKRQYHRRPLRSAVTGFT